jgi:predicted 3-demethylubiquinone-9 3-methyltransferase (glyoxalase superfamily)
VLRPFSTHLWFDKEAKTAAALYIAAFGYGSSITTSATLANTPSGSVDILTVKLLTYDFTLISAGPLFRFTPAISFLVTCASKAEVDARWQKLADGGTVRMPLDSYPFSPRYGWIEDRFGLSWQLFYKEGAPAQLITPTLMFSDENCGKAEEAVHFYKGIFAPATIEGILRYAAAEAPDREGTIKRIGFTLLGQHFAAMDSARVHKCPFNEAISFVVYCQNQREIDCYWEKLSAHPEAEQCGWLKDRYGLSWQIVPRELNQMLQDKDPLVVARVTEAFLKMKKFDLALLRHARKSYH